MPRNDTTRGTTSILSVSEMVLSPANRMNSSPDMSRTQRPNDVISRPIVKCNEVVISHSFLTARNLDQMTHARPHLNIFGQVLPSLVQTFEFIPNLLQVANALFHFADLVLH